MLCTNSSSLCLTVFAWAYALDHLPWWFNAIVAAVLFFGLLPRMGDIHDDP